MSDNVTTSIERLKGRAKQKAGEMLEAGRSGRTSQHGSAHTPGMANEATHSESADERRASNREAQVDR